VKLVVGLGNPGADYLNTPHNVGYQVVETMAARESATFKQQTRFRALTARVGQPTLDVLLAKPVTFMNRSGSAVSLMLQFYKSEPSDVLVVVDDVNLALGRLRIRPNGRSGGHRGLESSIETRGTDDFSRVRVGVGEARRGKNLVSHVLSPFKGDSLARFEEATILAADAVTSCIEQGVSVAMNAYNGRTIEDDESA
jgi:PTH1 family peptidyl-tRNA hydrolase